MSFLYPRTISIFRPAQAAGVGDRGYSAQTHGNETQLFSGIACSIQEGAQHKNPTGLPTDPRQSAWKVFIAKGVSPPDGAVKSGDIIVDDLARRFQISAPIPTSLGLEIKCLFLEP